MTVSGSEPNTIDTTSSTASLGYTGDVSTYSTNTLEAEKTVTYPQ